MTKEEKSKQIANISESISNSPVFYLADTSELTVDATNLLRRECFKNDITLTVVKNTLLKKALEQVEGADFSEMFASLTGPTSIMYSSVGNAPAKLIKEFRKKHDKPVLKAAFIEESIYVGEDKLDTLTAIKSKDELLGEIIGLLQSPAKNVISALSSGGNIIAGLVKTLSEK